MRSCLKIVLLILGFPALLFSQNKVKVQELDTSINVQKIILANFGKDVLNSTKKMGNWKQGLEMGFGMMEIKDLNDDDLKKRPKKDVGLCDCDIRGDKLYILQTRTIFGGMQLHFLVGFSEIRKTTICSLT